MEVIGTCKNPMCGRVHYSNVSLGRDDTRRLQSGRMTGTCKSCGSKFTVKEHKTGWEGAGEPATWWRGKCKKCGQYNEDIVTHREGRQYKGKNFVMHCGGPGCLKNTPHKLIRERKDGETPMDYGRFHTTISGRGF